jgi:hypothetical protein
MKNTNNIKLNSKNFDNVLNNIIDEISNDNQMNDFVDIEMDNMNIDNITIDNNENTIKDKNEESNALLNKIDMMTINNGWNDKNEKIIISLGENASSYKWMHERCASMYKLIHKIFSIILILFSTGLSAESIIPNDPNNTAISVLRRVFTYVITVLSVLQNFLNMEQLSEQHKSAATRYSELYHDIQKQMCLFRRDRDNAMTYLSNALKKYDSLVVAGPSINSIILNQFKNTFKNAEISIPDIADRIQKIEIITEPNDFSSQNNNNNNNSSNGNLQFQVQGDGQVQRFMYKIKKADKNKDEDLEKNSPNQKRYARYGNSNLKQINDVLKIHGDVTDTDIHNANEVELRELRKKFLDGKSSFEYERFKKHNTETD